MTFCTGFSVRTGDFRLPLLIILLLAASVLSPFFCAAPLPLSAGEWNFAFAIECSGDMGELWLLLSVFGGVDCSEGELWLVGDPFVDCGVDASGDVDWLESFGL